MKKTQRKKTNGKLKRLVNTRLGGVCSLFFCILILSVVSLQAKPRLIVTTDIGGDPDDQQSLVRLLTYSNEFDIEALIASASGTPGELGSAFTRPDLIRQYVNAYGDVRSKLVLHASGYPTEQYLLDRVKSGNKYRGTDNIGSGHDTEGSNFIISVVDKSDSRPVNVSIWGGQTDLAQALWKVKNSRSSSAYRSFVSKIRVHDIADQDGIFSYIRSNFPELWYVLDKTRSSDKCSSVFRGMFYQGNTTTVTKTWLRDNIKNNHGPLGALYPDDGLWSCGNGINGIKEGDTPSWFYFLDNGMHVPSKPSYGGWGGRFKVEGTNYWRDDTDTYDGDTRSTATVYRWRAEFQNDFKARMDWCVKTYGSANHNPSVTVNATAQTVESGDAVVMDAAGSSDPDGNSLSYEWMYYKEPGTWGRSISISNATSRAASFIAPDVTSDKTIHIILKVTDNGSPNLTSYKRVIITVQPYSGSSNESPAATVSTPADGASLTAGSVLNYSGTGSDPEDGTLSGSSLAWSIDRNNDGQGAVHTGSGTSGSYTLPTDISAPTTYTVTLTVTDSDGASDTDVHTVTVNPAGQANTAPTASISAPAAGDTLYAGDELAYSGSGSDPEDGTLGSSSLSWRIDRIGDGLGDVHTATGASGTYTLPDNISSPTEYRVYLIAADAGGLTDTVLHRVYVTERPAAPVIPTGSGRMEAEDMDLAGYSLQDLAVASGGKIITTESDGTARYAYSGAAGTMDIVVAYYDENDGSSNYVLLLNGSEIDRWTADRDLGSASPDAVSAVTRTVEDVALSPDDVIAITSDKDTGERGRIDYIETVVPQVSGMHAPQAVPAADLGQLQGTMFDTAGRAVTAPGAGIYFKLNADGSGFTKVMVIR